MIKDFIASIGKVNEYHRLKNNPMWKTIVYLLLISLLFGLVFSSSFQNRYNKLLIMVAESYDTKIPEFKIENSQLNTANNEKVLIEKDKGAIIFDTSEGADENALGKYDYGALFLKDKFIIKSTKHSIMTKSWEQFSFEGYDKPMIREMIGSIPMLMLIITIFTIAALIFISIINSLFISIALLLAKKLWKIQVTFVQIFKMSIYSMTLPMVIMSVLSVSIGDRIALKQYYYLFYISVVYLLIALRRGEVKPKVIAEVNSKVIPKVNSKKKK
jgi:hypothetical protein